MKDIFKYFRRHRSRKPVFVSPSFDVKSYLPMSFGVSFRCVALQDASVRSGLWLELRNDTRTARVQCLQVEKDSVISIQETECKQGEEVGITVAYTKELVSFSLKKVTLAVLE